MHSLDANPPHGKARPGEACLQYRCRGQPVGIVVVKQGNLRAGGAHLSDAFANFFEKVLFAHVLLREG
jgi:hypothetical protein